MAYGENLYLSLPDFGSHIQTVWKLSQKETDFCDVTLGCEDKLIEAHKLVLGSSSPVLKNILGQISNRAPFIYLKGVKHKDLQNILCFIYQGEVNVDTDDIPSFFEVANDLKIKGLSKSMRSVKEDKLNIFGVPNNNEGHEALLQCDNSDNVKETVSDNSTDFIMHEKNKNKKLDLSSQENFDIINHSPLKNMLLTKADVDITKADANHIQDLAILKPNHNDQAALLEYDTLNQKQLPMSTPSKMKEGKRRKVRKSYDRAENQILIELVSTLKNGKYKEQIKSGKTSNEQRHKMWMEVTNYFNSATGNNLSLKQVRDKYNRDKSKMRDAQSYRPQFFYSEFNLNYEKDHGS